MSKKKRDTLLGFFVILVAVAVLFEKIDWGWFWVVVASLLIGTLVKVFYSGHRRAATGWSGRLSKSEKRDRSKTYRDYGRESMASSGLDDVIKSIRFVSALDEHTCLKCLELDGTENPPEPPIHEGCRCVTIPVTKTWEELGEKNPSYTDVEETPDAAREILKVYLIERAKGLGKGLEGAALASHLKTILPSLKKRYPDETDSFAEIKAKVLALDPTDDPAELEDVLENLISTSDELKPIFKRCAELQRFDLIDKALEKFLKQVPYDKGILYRVAGDSVKKVSLEKAVEYFELTEKTNHKNTAVMMELGRLYRRTKRFNEARKMFKKVLRVKPTHKGAKQELDRLRKYES